MESLPSSPPLPPSPPTPSASTLAGTTHVNPESLSDLFWSFTLLALQGFGGLLAVVQRELVERKHWFTPEEFVEEWAVAQILPGPNVINLALMLGDRQFGLRGAMVGLAGLMFFPTLLVLGLAAIFVSISDFPAAQGALRGMGAVVAGVITATGFKMIPALKSNAMGETVGLAVTALTFVVIALLRVPLATMLLLLGTAACLWAYRQLGRLRALEQS